MALNSIDVNVPVLPSQHLFCPSSQGADSVRFLHQSEKLDSLRHYNNRSEPNVTLRFHLHPIDVINCYEKIAMIEASSDFAFKDMSLEITDQRKTDKALARLKEEAASLGANGIVIQSLSNKNKLHFSLRKDDRGNLNADTRNEKQKELKAIAIFVK